MLIYLELLESMQPNKYLILKKTLVHSEIHIIINKSTLDTLTNASTKAYN